ncbi:uncharacterized protein TrAtP1_009411 [Trichoderma atroviride]|nr:hypothetical protein TrAtP1_009411 [Trichoderma atroviride]
MQLAEPYRFELEEPSPYLTIQCPPNGSFSSVSSNSSSPYEVFTPISRRSTPNDIRMDFDGPYQFASTPTPPSAVVMHKYMYPVNPVKAEHERMSFSSSDGTLSPSTPHRKMHGVMSHEYMLDVNSINSHSMGSISPSGPVHAYTEAPLPSTSYSIMTPTHSVSPSEIVESNGTTWCSSDSPIFFRPKQQSPQHVEPLNLHQRYSESPMGQRYNNYHPLSQSSHRLASQRGPAWNAAVMTKSADLQETIRMQSKVVPEKNDPGSYDVVRKAMCKCDYPNCHKAFRRNEHLKRHKQTFHGEGPNRFSCEFCGKDQFNRQDNLNNHRKLHARPNSRNRGVEFIAAAVPVIEQEERSRKRRAPPKSRLPTAGMPAEKRY